MATEHELPPWAGAPKLEFQLFKNATKMARSYHSLGVNLRRLLTQKSDEEGGTQYVQDLEISDSLGFVHAIPELPTKPGYFIIVMLPPPDIEDDTIVDGEVELLFAADTMYHLGFSAKIVWYVFQDAILPGVKEGSEAKYNIERLTLKGSYQDIGMDFEELIIGFLGQLETYRVLVDYKHASRSQLVQVSCRNVVTFSEPMRFPFLFKLNLTTFQLGNLHAVLDVPVKKNETYRNVSYHFNDWSNYSEKCRQGRKKFAAEWQRSHPEFSKYILSGIPTFDALLNFVGLLSNKIHKKSHKEEEPEKRMKRSFGNPEDRRKGGGDEDPPSDKDGNKERRKNKDTSSAWFFEAPVMPYHWIDRALDITKVRYCSENIKRLIYFSSCEVCGKIIGSFLAKDHPHHKETDFFVLKVDESQYIFGPIAKQRRSYSCVTQLIFSEGLENDLEFTIVSPFNWIGPRMDFIPDTDGPSQGAPWVLACFSNNLLRRETWKLADGGDSQRTSVCMKEAIGAVLLMIENPARANAHISIAREFAEMMTDAHGNVPGEPPLHKSLIAVSAERLYGEGYEDRIADVILIIKRLVGHISTVGDPNTFTAREFTEMMTYVHDSVPGEPLLEKPLIEVSAEHFLGKGSDGSNDKRIPGVTPNNKKQLGEPLLGEPLIEVSAEHFVGEGYDDSGKTIPDVTVINRQLGWNPIDAPPKDLLATTLTTYQNKTCRQVVKRQMSQAPSSSYTTCRGFGFCGDTAHHVEISFLQAIY